MKPSEMAKKQPEFNKADYLLCLLVFLVCFTGACLFSLGQCPDEVGRQLLTDYILKYGRLPKGDEPEVIVRIWGFSYALRPYLSSIISAFFGKLVLLFTDSAALLRPAYRMGSVLSIVLTAAYSLKTGKLIFQTDKTARLYASIIVFLPQVLFLGMYLNNDSLSLMAFTVIVYYYLVGRKNNWNIRSCVGLGVGFSIALLSYYTVYGWILIAAVFFLISLIKIKAGQAFVSKRLLIVFIICFVLAGWYFIRNMMIHNGDIFGLITEKKCLDALKEQGIEPLPYLSLYEKGFSFHEFWIYKDYFFVKTTAGSFFGCFGNMEFPLPLWMYIFYCFYYGFGFALYCLRRIKQEKPDPYSDLVCLMAYSSLITMCFHVYMSYVRDMQPQGRYIITLVLFFSYLITTGFDFFSEQVSISPEHKKSVTAWYNATYLVLTAWAIMGTMTQMLV